MPLKQTHVLIDLKKLRVCTKVEHKDMKQILN